MTGGFVALLDVLGFSALVGADPAGDRIRDYLTCLQNATGTAGVDYVVFSDSIVLSAKGDAAESFLEVASTCSRLLSALLEEGIAIRGAISFGGFFRSAVAESVFVAGRSVVDAYQFEQAQDWVGVMVAPSALARVPDLETRCSLHGHNSPEGFASFQSRVAWAAAVQPCHAIPFHTATPFEQSSFDGFAIVPTNGIQPTAVLRSIESSMERLRWLRGLAPSPAAQNKYRETLNWLGTLVGPWRMVVQSYERWTPKA